MREPVERGLLMRAGVPARDAATFVNQGLSPLLGGATYLVDVANGHVFARGASDAAAVRKAAQRFGGYAVVLAASPDAVGAERWGHIPETLDLMRALKARWDVAAAVNPGAFIV
jgi:hypothetical protein